MRKNMSSIATVLAVFCACSSTIQWTPADAANILAVLTISGKSHWNVMRAVLKPLTDRGHNLTVFTPFAEGDRDGYTEVDVSKQMVPILSVDATYLIEKYGQMRTLVPRIINYTRKTCDIIYGHPRMADILDRPEVRQFDLVVTEPMGSECVAYLATVLSVPMVYVVPFPAITYLERSLTGHTPNPAAAGHSMSHFDFPKTFVERFANTMLTVYCSMLMWYAELQGRQADPQPYDSVDLARPSMIFINAHFTTEPARPQTPDVIQIGGIHLTPPKPIPKVIHSLVGLFQGGN